MSVAPIYLQPQYITYGMIELELGQMKIEVNQDADPDLSGIYIGQVNDLMAKAEAYVIKSILSDYVKIPLTTVKGTDFNDLYNDPDLYSQYGATYAEIRDLFISESIWQIYKVYYASGGTSNALALVKQYSNKISIYTNQLRRLDQAGNPQIKNAFAGLIPAANASKRIPSSSGGAVGIPSGNDQAYAAFNAQPNLRWGFNR